MATAKKAPAKKAEEKKADEKVETPSTFTSNDAPYPQVVVQSTADYEAKIAKHHAGVEEDDPAGVAHDDPAGSAAKDDNND